MSSNTKHFQSKGGSEFAVTPLQEGILSRMGRDLTVLAHQGKLMPVWGRDKEIQKIIEILGRKTKPNPILLGEAGVGKTALVEKLAQFIVENPTDLPAWVRDCKLIEISYIALASQSSQNWSEYLENIRQAFQEAASKPIILFIDEIHQLWAFPISFNYVKPLIARGDVRIIGATTLMEYHKYLETDAALNRRFFPVYISEPAPEEVIKILETLAPLYRQHYQIDFDKSVFAPLVEFADIYLPNYRQPGISIEILESAFVRKRVMARKSSPENKVDLKIVRDIIAERAKVPVRSIETVRKKFGSLLTSVSSQIVGQEEVVRRVVDRVVLCKARLDINPSRPDGIFLFAGPPGVGKTELAKVLAKILSGKEEGLIFMDMANFSSPQSYNQLIRPPRRDSDSAFGDVPFLQRVRDTAHGVLLLDEIDKAHPVIWNFFFKIFDEGRVEDDLGIVTDFSNMTIIMTTNIGFSVASGTKSKLGFTVDRKAALEKLTEERILHEIESYFPAAFLNRVDDILIFKRLSRKDCGKILRLNIQKYAAGLKKKLVLTAEAENFLLNKGFSDKYGARYLIRVIENEIGRLLLQVQKESSTGKSWERIKKIYLGADKKQLKIVKVQ